MKVLKRIIYSDSMSFESQLSKFLIDCEKLIVLGVGNELKSDDGIGPVIINKLKEENIENKKKLLFINAQTVPENFTGKIRKEKPTHLIIVDACLMDAQPGDIKIVNKYDFANIGISTHSMSLSFFVRYLERDTDINVVFVGIQPKSLDYGQPTDIVLKSAYDFIDKLKEIIL